MLVSVIMGIYNMKNIEHAIIALDSVFKQTYKNIEIIICNDGSNNLEYQEIERYAISDNRVVIISNLVNKGLAFSLNHALKYAKGELIARMDIDDYISLDRIEKQVDFIKENPDFDIVGTNAHLIDEEGVWGELNMPTFPTKNDFLINSPFIHASTIIRKNKLIEIGGYRVANETRRAEDFDLWMRLYANGSKGYNIQEKLYYIREDKQAYSRRKYRFRIDESIVRYKGYKLLDIFTPGKTVYVLRPLIVGLLPNFLIKKIRKKRGKKHEKDSTHN